MCIKLSRKPVEVKLLKEKILKEEYSRESNRGFLVELTVFKNPRGEDL